MSWRKQIAGVQLGYDVLTDDQREFWYAPSSGPLHAAWKDKPTRLLYDLIRIWLAKDAEIERLKGDNARFQSAHDGLLAEIDKLAKHDMAVGTALRETREALETIGKAVNNIDSDAGPCPLCHCGPGHSEACPISAILARHAPLAGEANHA